MDKKIISKLSDRVSKKFPEMVGVRPIVKPEADSKNGTQKYLLTYKGQAALPGGKKLKRIVRVIADERGRVIRMSTSK
jgi:hypothetical protein